MSHVGLNFTTYAEAQIGNAILRGSSGSFPSQLYVAFFSAGPNEDGTGTELSVSGYSRQMVSFGVGVPNAPTDTGTTWTNASAVVWPVATTDWGSPTGIGLMDAVSGGNMWLYGNVSGGDIASGKYATIGADGLIVILG